MNRTPSATTKARALRILEGVQEINRRERLRSGAYIQPLPDQDELEAQGAICGGNEACLLGSAWLAAGAKPYYSVDASEFVLPGIVETPTRNLPVGRDEYLRRRPALKLAVDALHESALRRCKKLGLVHNEREFAHAGEWLLEYGLTGAAVVNHVAPSGWDRYVQKNMSIVVAGAKRIVENL